MPIRFATVDDIPALVALGKRMHAITRFRSFDYDEERVARSLREALAAGNARYVALVAVGGGHAIVGGLLGVLERHIFTQELTASVMHFDVLPECRMGGYGVRLLKGFEQWARNRGVMEIAFGINSGIEEAATIARFARRSGFRKVGENFIKGVGHVPSN